MEALMYPKDKNSNAPQKSLSFSFSQISSLVCIMIAQLTAEYTDIESLSSKFNTHFKGVDDINITQTQAY